MTSPTPASASEIQIGDGRPVVIYIKRYDSRVTEIESYCLNHRLIGGDRLLKSYLHQQKFEGGAQRSIVNEQLIQEVVLTSVS